MSWKHVNDIKKRIASESKTKVCSICKVNKLKSEYAKCSAHHSAVQSSCKDCVSKSRKKKYWDNRDESLAKMTKSRLKPENVQQRKCYYQKNKESYVERYNKYLSDESKMEQYKEADKLYYIKNKEKIQARNKRNQEREEVKEKRREKHHERKKTDIEYVIKRRLRFRLTHILKALGGKKYKYASAIELLGCDMIAFEKHIEGLFSKGMSWDLVFDGIIHIDHKKPCAAFDLTKEEEQKKCFHYTNLQPMWAVENIQKNAIYDGIDYRRIKREIVSL